MVRHATVADASRIAEILVFSKRMNYRKIFHNDKVSFGEMQVYPLARDYIDDPSKLEGIWIYDDEFVKGMIHLEGKEVAELYVDPFFEKEGIGCRLIQYGIERYDCDSLWVLEKNIGAIRFYQKHGFMLTENKRFEQGTEELVVQMKR